MHGRTDSINRFYFRVFLDFCFYLRVLICTCEVEILQKNFVNKHTMFRNQTLNQQNKFFPIRFWSHRHDNVVIDM